MYTENRDENGLLVSIKRDADSATVPLDGTSPGRLEYEAWLATGNSPKPAPSADLISPTWNGSTWAEGAPLADVRAKKSALLQAALGAYQQARYPAGLLSAIDRARSRGAHGVRVAAFDAWIDTVVAHYTTALAAISTDTGDPVADLATVQAATWDFTQFDATDPVITLGEVITP